MQPYAVFSDDTSAYSLQWLYMYNKNYYGRLSKQY